MSDEERQPTPVVPIDIVPGTTVADLLRAMACTGYQGRSLGRALEVLEEIARDPAVTVFLGLAGSLCTAGQSGIITWLIRNGFVDVLVTTGANVSEDLVETMGGGYVQADLPVDDAVLCAAGHNRYHDVCGREVDYVAMIDLIAAFLETLSPECMYTSRELLARFGSWLGARGIGGIAQAAADAGVPIFCPALMDSAYGDAALVARSGGHRITVDAVADYAELMSLDVGETAVIYVGGGVPKDVIQTFAVSADLLFPARVIPGRPGRRSRAGADKSYYPHKYAIQITSDSPQWGGSSGATLDEGVSWGKLAPGSRFVDCRCDATIALPLLVQALAERVGARTRTRRFFASGPPP